MSLIAACLPSFRVSAVMARASSMRQASSLLPRRRAISANESSSNLRSRMTSRCARRQRFERRLELFRLFVEDHARQRRARERRHRRLVVQRHLPRGVAALPLMVVGAIADLVVRDAREPPHERAGVVCLQLVQVFERLHHCGLEDVARLEPRYAARVRAAIARTPAAVPRTARRARSAPRASPPGHGESDPPDPTPSFSRRRYHAYARSTDSH